MSAHILLVEDDKPIADNVILALNRDGFDCTHVQLGAACLDTLTSKAIDLVILDIGLPDMGGFEVCKKIRQTSNIPIIFLTARSDEIDRVVGLEIGADDYVLKPFSPRELAARVKTILRRGNHIPQTNNSAINSFQVDEDRACICCNGVDLVLTRAEFLLLGTMIRSPRKVFSREALMDAAGLADASMDRVVDTHIKSMRAKLSAAAPGMEFIHTHRGLGYSFIPAT